MSVFCSFFSLYPFFFSLGSWSCRCVAERESSACEKNARGKHQRKREREKNPKSRRLGRYLFFCGVSLHAAPLPGIKKRRRNKKRVVAFLVLALGCQPMGRLKCVRLLGLGGKHTPRWRPGYARTTARRFFFSLADNCRGSSLGSGQNAVSCSSPRERIPYRAPPGSSSAAKKRNGQQGQEKKGERKGGLDERSDRRFRADCPASHQHRLQKKLS